MGLPSRFVAPPTFEVHHEKHSQDFQVRAVMHLHGVRWTCILVIMFYDWKRLKESSRMVELRSVLDRVQALAMPDERAEISRRFGEFLNGIDSILPEATNINGKGISRRHRFNNDNDSALNDTTYKTFEEEDLEDDEDEDEEVAA